MLAISPAFKIKINLSKLYFLPNKKYFVISRNTNIKSVKHGKRGYTYG